MQISEVINAVKGFCKGTDRDGNPIDSVSTRDQVLHGGVDRKCTGIVTTIYASPEVIKKAAALGANLIISHETCFWCRGGHTAWLHDDPTFQAKSHLLDELGITVWRCHDFIHSGVPLGAGGAYVDGIFYGLAHKLGWEEYCLSGDYFHSVYEIPETTLDGLARTIVSALGVNGARVIGAPGTPVRRVRIPGHAFGGNGDDHYITENRELNVDCELFLELVDFTIAAYVRDANELGFDKCAITVGHFDVEEPGMEYMVEWLPQALGALAENLSLNYVQAGGFSRYLTA